MSDHPKRPSRRAFLTKSGAAVGGGLLALHFSSLLALGEEAHKAHLKGAAFQTLTTEEAAELQAMAAQIVPTDDTPGATEAGVIYFMDLALGTTDGGNLAVIRQGLPDVTALVHERHPGTATFSALASTDQIALLQEIQDTPLFKAVRFLTMAGMFSHPSYGGNRDRIGWKLIGFDDRHFWQPPFGHYDVNYVDPYRNGE